MQINLNKEVEEKIKSLPNPDEFINSILREALLEHEKRKKSLKDAAQALLEDYKNNPDLTAFTALDGEDFHV